jgi:hypothetical protein
MMHAFVSGFGFVLGLVVSCALSTAGLALLDYALEWRANRNKKDKR